MEMSVGYGGCFGPSGPEYVIQQIFAIYTLVVLLWAAGKLGALLVALFGSLQDVFD